MNSTPPRVLWLLNHGTARAFELGMMRKAGIREIFTPKRFLQDPSFRSASVDFSLDADLTIPRADLKALNEADWYGDPGRQIWDIANRHFDILFSSFLPLEDREIIAKRFQGAVLWRVYGNTLDMSYTRLMGLSGDNRVERALRSLGERFWFAEAYGHLHERESDLLKERRLHLPLGLWDCRPRTDWTGEDRRLLFICPDIGFNPYYRAFYQEFLRDFHDFDYAIGGVQPIFVKDPRILGFLPKEEHERNMRRMRVLYYPSREPYHVHYHPFEAVRAGMPLIFLSGGMLDRLGGLGLPGRCQTVGEARRKIRRILQGDEALTESIRRTQMRLLEVMKPENSEKNWIEGFQRILAGLERSRAQTPMLSPSKTRVAVLLPVGFRGGSLAAAKLLARAIERGGQQKGKEVEVVLGYLDEAGLYRPEDFSDLPPSIKVRPYHWRTLEADEAARAMAYLGLKTSLNFSVYQVPEDGIRQFMDCDLWVLVSDRMEKPLLPVKDYVLAVHDYVQRYEKLWDRKVTTQFLWNAHQAKRVWVTTEFTRQDALQFAGLDPQKVIKLPLIAPAFNAAADGPREEKPYFLWTTNLSPHKNQQRAMEALRLYYEKQEGKLDCRVTGVGTERLFTEKSGHLKGLPALLDSSGPLKRALKVMGELPVSGHQNLLAGSEFLWHAGTVDNGTYSVVEAAYRGVPSLSSDYPAMREIDGLGKLNLSWMDPYDPEDMARQLKKMETESRRLRSSLPSPGAFEGNGLEKAAPVYWEAVEDCS